MEAGGETIFTKIINREIPADIVYETDTVIAFRDISPKAPVHILIVPKKLIVDVNFISEADTSLMGELFQAVVEVAEAQGVKESGYRLIVNTGSDGGQEVPHLHIHLLGGRGIGPMVVG